jgi:seryl-tRNA synthetase
MLDVKVLREDAARVEEMLASRGAGISLREFLALDAKRRRLLQEIDSSRASRRRASQAVAERLRQGAQADERQIEDLKKASREAGTAIARLEEDLKKVEEETHAVLLGLPNLPHPSVPVGGEEMNQEVRRCGAPRRFAFDPRPHWELGERLGVLDFKRAAKIAKARFAVLWGPGARLERALAQFMLDLHTKEHGYREVWVPHLVNAEAMLGTGQLPKFEDQLFKTVEPEGERPLYLIPTAEVPVTCLHGGEILREDELPKRYVAFTPCYRREAGAAGKDTRGMIRQHQFDKVEMVKVTTPAASHDELESMVANAEEVLRRLELPYRVMLLSTGDMGFSSAKTYDLEVWLPGQGKYREISSCSNCEAFQARRAQIRYRPAGGGKTEYCHTLNGSGLAVGRTLIAIFENYQEADGSVRVPPALRPYMDGVERLAPLGT